MAGTTLEHIEQLVDKLSPEEQRQLIQNLAQRLKNNAGETTLRPYGLCRGEFVVPNDFDAPLPDDVIEAFENS